MKSLEIKNYKNFKKLALNDLASINLIVGKNNVGKSALLEAISIFASNGDLETIKSILESRGEGVRFASFVENRTEKELERFLSLYRNRDMQAFLNNGIEISAEEKVGMIEDRTRFTMQLVEFIESKETDSEGFVSLHRKVLNREEKSKDENQDANIGLLLSHAGRKTLYTFNGANRRNPAETPTAYEYVRTNQIMGDKNPKLFDRIALTPNEKYIIEALRIIEPLIEGINFLQDDNGDGSSSRKDNRVPFVIFSDSPKRYRLSTMGDGINRILTIILAMLNCENGFLLIDEFENGLHYSVQYELWKIILLLSKQLNVQVFATTHSNDTLRGLSQLIREHPVEEMKKEIACYYLQKTQAGEINGYRYDAGNFEYLIDRGEEIR